MANLGTKIMTQFFVALPQILFLYLTVFFVKKILMLKPERSLEVKLRIKNRYLGKSIRILYLSNFLNKFKNKLCIEISSLANQYKKKLRVNENVFLIPLVSKFWGNRILVFWQVKFYRKTKSINWGDTYSLKNYTTYTLCFILF